MQLQAADFNADYFARMAELEDSHPWTRAMRALTFAWLERAGTPVAARVLDVGCGTGLFLTEWTRRWRVSNAYGIDLFREALRYATHRTRAHWCAASAAAPPFGSGLFDAIHCADVLQHLSLKETERAFDFFAAGLRPGGLLALRVRGSRWLMKTPEVDFSHTFTPARLRTALTVRGLVVERLSRVNCAGSVFAELSEWRSPATANAAPVKGITPRAKGDLRARLLGWLLGLEHQWLTRARMPLPVGHTILCVARKPA